MRAAGDSPPYILSSLALSVAAVVLLLATVFG
jgi:hypothetical protein